MQYAAEKFKFLSRRWMIPRGHATVCHDNHERQHRYENRGRKKAGMEMRKPIRDIDEFNHRKSKKHGLIPPISALPFGFELPHLA